VRHALQLGRQAVAEEVVKASEEAAALAPGVPSVRGAALRCRGLMEGDPERLAAAVEVARTGPRILDRMGTCEDAAYVMTSAGRVAEARSHLMEVLALQEDLSARSWAARTRASLRDLGVRHGARGGRSRPASGWESLTRTEREVANLASEGLTNRQIASQLFISPNTVNTHMRHLFQKLEVSSRAGLAAATLRRHEAPPE
jgi:DNA-binding CsgD family transcriptional regulator